jgi:hypothetical protein
MQLDYSRESSKMFLALSPATCLIRGFSQMHSSSMIPIKLLKRFKLYYFHSGPVVAIDPDVANLHVLGKLLHGRLSPARERSKIRDGWVVVIVGVPQVMGCEVRAARSGPENGRPGQQRRKHAHPLPRSICARNKLLGVLAVAIPVIVVPLAGVKPRVVLNFHPDSVVQVLVDPFERIVYLG